ncbi:disease resistance protein RPP2B-like [Mangifera indica]|uniref:disease resistance protein RPP2B-like n=1 Tax=Mangifera indica TaxID=29780 RepID=UPI001CFBD3D1|nr:disease resistance protein RPP2B-like [Mangifera indica]
MVCLKKLKGLTLRGYNFKECVDLMLSCLSGFQFLSGLDLSNCCITELPSSLGELTSLQSLNIGFNKFKSIPASIINLSKLSWLNVRGCDVLKSFPELPSSLKYLYAYDCYSLELLSSLPISWSTAWGLEEVNFSNCFKLDQSVLEGIVKSAPQNIQPSATESFGYGTNGKWILYPGSSIPQWFTFQSKGSFIKLLPGGLNGDLVGLLFCIVISPRDHHDEVKDFNVKYELHLKSDGGQYAQKAEGSWNVMETPDSDHIFLGYEASWSAQFCFNSEVLFQFYIEDEDFRRLECYEVKECGVNVLLYLQTSSGPMKESVTSFSSEENKEDQQHAERLEFRQITKQAQKSRMRVSAFRKWFGFRKAPKMLQNLSEAFRQFKKDRKRVAESRQFENKRKRVSELI